MCIMCSQRNLCPIYNTYDRYFLQRVRMRLNIRAPNKYTVFEHLTQIFEPTIGFSHTLK